MPLFLRAVRMRCTALPLDSVAAASSLMEALPRRASRNITSAARSTASADPPRSALSAIDPTLSNRPACALASCCIVGAPGGSVNNLECSSKFMQPTPPGAATPAGRLRHLIQAPGILVMPGVFDGFSVRLVEAMGFEAGFVTGSGVSESRWGWPDVGLMSKAESLDGVRALAEAAGLPLLADADTGYGNAVNVFHTVREFEKAGVGGVMIEDQTWPKRCGHMSGKDVIDAGEMVQKIHAAVDARRDPELVIEARTDAAGPIGIEEAIRRGRLYAEAGADLIFADALLTEDDIRRFCQEV